ncbi:MAG: hypothetical protein ABH842_03370 [Candidatus Micrarchaeota archaeon]
MAERGREVERDIHGQIPTPVITLASIRKQLLPEIPMSVAGLILKLEDPALIQRKIAEVNKAAQIFVTDGPTKPPESIPIERMMDITAIRAATRQREPEHFKAPEVLQLLRNEDIAGAFIEDPMKIAGRLQRIFHFGVGEKGKKEDIMTLVGVLSDSVVAKCFVEHPYAFVSIALNTRRNAFMVFAELENEKLAALFGKYHQSFVEMARCTQNEDSFALLAEDETFRRIFEANPSLFTGAHKYAREQPQVFDEIMDSLKTSRMGLSAAIINTIARYDHVSIEIGRALDDLHDNTEERKQYLKSLTRDEVIGLLASNPEFFYTSSNHMLFDRLKEELEGHGLSHLKETYGLGEEQLRNFVFRAVVYDRIGDFITAEGADLQLAMATILGTVENKTGIYADTFNEGYFYLMANGIETLSKYAPELTGELSRRRKELEALGTRTLDQEKILAALTYVNFMFTRDPQGDDALEKVADGETFNRTDYRGQDGRVTVLQIFDKEDTGAYHWGATKTWFQKQFGASPRKGPNGELIFENSSSRVILYMGNDEDANIEYTRAWTQRYDKGIVTFRGHSFSLSGNMPTDIFGNREGKYVFIPGSCGSAGSVPEYIYQNPNTEVRFFSNSSTGRGQVTNTLVSLLLRQTRPSTFTNVLESGKTQIARAGGDIATIKAFTQGEALLYYVMARTTPTVEITDG